MVMVCGKARYSRCWRLQREMSDGRLLSLSEMMLMGGFFDRQKRNTLLQIGPNIAKADVLRFEADASLPLLTDVPVKILPNASILSVIPHSYLLTVHAVLFSFLMCIV